MPTYQYACTACDHRLEAVQSFSDDPLTQCPACAGRLRKLFGSVGVVFKGSGFYRTDSRAAANGKRDAGTESTTDSRNGKQEAGQPDKSGKSDKSGDKSDSGGSGGSGGSGDTVKPATSKEKAPATT